MTAVIIFFPGTDQVFGPLIPPKQHQIVHKPVDLNITRILTKHYALSQNYALTNHEVFHLQVKMFKILHVCLIFH
jgi:hypothetical protein